MDNQLKVSTELLRGHVETIILKLLIEQDRYGYEICKQITLNSNNQFELKEATLYASLRRMEQDQKIVAYWGDETSGGRRKYYSITETGKSTYSNNKLNWEYAKQILDKLI